MIFFSEVLRFIEIIDTWMIFYKVLARVRYYDVLLA